MKFSKWRGWSKSLQLLQRVVFLVVINFRNETESNSHFLKMSRKQEIVSDISLKAWPFSSDFNFICKDYRVTAATCKYYCLLVVNPATTNCCKKLNILNVAEFLGPSLKTLPCTKTSPVLCEKVFFLIPKCCQLYWKSLCFSQLLFTVWWSIFYRLFRQLLPLSCFYGSSQWLFKVKITCKRINFIKK